MLLGFRSIISVCKNQADSLSLMFSHISLVLVFLRIQPLWPIWHHAYSSVFIHILTRNFSNNGYNLCHVQVIMMLPCSAAEENVLDTVTRCSDSLHWTLPHGRA